MNERDLAFVDTFDMKAKVLRLIRSGVRFVNKRAPWEHITIGPDVEIAAGTLIWPGVVLLGNTKVGENCEVGPDISLEDTAVGTNTRIKRGCEITRSQIGNNCIFHPFCYIADSDIRDHCTMWVNVSMLHADVKDHVTVHRDSRIVWSNIDEDCNIESYCPIKYANVGAKCKVGPTAFIEGEKFDEETLRRGERSIRIGHSSTIGFKTHIHGWTTINPEAELLDANILNSFIGKRVKAQGCRIDDSKVYHDCVIEEGAYIHDESTIKEGCEIARCEITRSTLGKNSKAKHHGYIGDMTAGRNLNWGAGAVTGNYDGKKKWPLKIGNGVFIGINCSIVSKSVKEIGDEAFIGAHMLVRSPVEANTAIAPPKELVRPIRWSTRTTDGWELTRMSPSNKPKSKYKKTTPEP